MLTNLDETSDIHNFSSTVKVIEFVGIDPGTYQSGEYSAPQTALSKRGSRYLRKKSISVHSYSMQIQSHFQ